MLRLVLQNWENRTGEGGRAGGPFPLDLLLDLPFAEGFGSAPAAGAGILLPMRTVTSSLPADSAAAAGVRLRPVWLLVALRLCAERCEEEEEEPLRLRDAFFAGCENTTVSSSSAQHHSTRGDKLGAVQPSPFMRHPATSGRHSL